MPDSKYIESRRQCSKSISLVIEHDGQLRCGEKREKLGVEIFQEGWKSSSMRSVPAGKFHWNVRRQQISRLGMQAKLDLDLSPGHENGDGFMATTHTARSDVARLVCVSNFSMNAIVKSETMRRLFSRAYPGESRTPRSGTTLRKHLKEDAAVRRDELRIRLREFLDKGSNFFVIELNVIRRF